MSADSSGIDWDTCGQFVYLAAILLPGVILLRSTLTDMQLDNPNTKTKATQSEEQHVYIALKDFHRPSMTA